MRKWFILFFISIAIISTASAFTGNNTTYYAHGDFVEGSEKGNTSAIEVYWVITQEPVQINGYFDGDFAYVGFFPMQDSYTYFVPFANGTFIFHCNPDSVDLGESIICTGTLYNDSNQPIDNARIEWELFDYNETSYSTGDFDFVSNGVYKFRVDVTPNLNLTTGDFYFIFDAEGFNYDYTFPFYINFEDKLVFVLPAFIFAAILIFLATNVTPIKSNTLLQILSLITGLFFAAVGFAIQLELANVANILTSLSQVPYQAVIFLIIATLALIFFIIIWRYFKLAGKVPPKWDRKEHRYK